MEDFFDEIDSSLLLFFILMALTKEENSKVTVDENKENDTIDEKLEDRLETDVREAVLQTEPVSYICKSRNKKRLRPKTVYF